MTVRSMILNAEHIDDYVQIQPYQKMADAITAGLHSNAIPASRQKLWLVNWLGVSPATGNRIVRGKSNLADLEMLKLASTLRCELKLKLCGPGDAKKVVEIDLNNLEAAKPYKSLARIIANQLESAGLRTLEVAQILKCSPQAARRKLNGQSCFKDHELSVIFVSLGFTDWAFEYSTADQESSIDTSKEAIGDLTADIKPASSRPGLIDENFTGGEFPVELFSWFSREIEIAIMEHTFSRGRVPRYRLDSMRLMARELAQAKGVPKRKISHLTAGLASLLNLPDPEAPHP